MVIKWDVKRTADGLTGTITLPIEGLAWQAHVPRQAGQQAALKRAAAHALASLHSPAIQALLPPQAQLAIRLLPKVTGISRKIARLF